MDLVVRLFVLMLALPASTLAATNRLDPATARFAVYYGAADVAGLFDRELVVLDAAAHPQLPPKRSTHRVLGYLSLGEIDKSRPYFQAMNKAGALRGKVPAWPDARYVDIRAPQWQARVLDELAPAILAQGFDGFFLDTLDDPPFLEARAPKAKPNANRGMSDAAVALVAQLRARFPDAVIMVNRGYEILPRLAPSIDFVLAESLHADWDAKTKAYRRVPPAEIDVQRTALAAARAANKDLQIASLDYWDPSDVAGVSALYREARSEGLIPYVATLALDRVVPEP
ncbi:endo alpha-1,4 polygalactosaminidase [Roseiterribacter gracilis]|uniref:Glycoside-hydrolase family GH114 TIM-barrel domain-containing protein n=1 Tax=Roseiterribacter gracilis TaxID=2812848 RepID=A0A8S8XL18_9PROT|nr:hypothetical protein TMPK1_41030 [Rhodospirillales bacterium TMPK1]